MLAEGRYDAFAPADPGVAVLVLHPHPDYGGTRFNPVVDAVYTAAVDAGWAALRFDFSSSDPAIATAEAETALQLLPEAETVAVIGYSYGAAIAGHLVDPRITAWVLIAPPFGTNVAAASLGAGTDRRPKLVLVPAHDQFCPPADARAATADWETAYVEAVPSADHFLAGATAEVASRALQFVTT